MRNLRRFTSGVAAVFQKRQSERDLDDEVRSYVEASAAEKMRAGMSRDQAIRAARLEFDGVEAVKEEVRSVGWESLLESLWLDIRYAVRWLVKAPAFSIVAVLTLALGIGANTALFTVVNGVLLRPLPFPHPEDLLLVADFPPHAPFGFSTGTMTDRHYAEYARIQHSFERVATFNHNDGTLTGAGDPVRLSMANVTAELFNVLGVPPVLGRGFVADDELPGRNRVVVLSDALWHSRFAADRRVLGSSITLDAVPHTVIGIMPPGFDFPNDAQMWTPVHVVGDPHNIRVRPVVGRLRSGVTSQQALAELQAFDRALPLDPDEQAGERVPQVSPLKELLVGEARKSLLIFLGAVAFVLLIACANVANLLLMRAAGRMQEIAVRAALGAKRARLIRQILTESVLIALAGCAVGLVLTAWSVPALLALAPAGQIPRANEIHVDATVLAFAIGVALLTGIVFGFAPALHATRRDLHATMAQGGRTVTSARERLRSSLVVGEVAIALMLLIGAGLLVRSFLRMRSVDLRFRPENVLTMSVDLPRSQYSDVNRMREFHSRVLERLAALPGVDSVAAVNWRPMGQMLIRGDFHLDDGRKLPDNYMVDKLGVSPGYFRTFGIRMLRGRDFDAHDDASAPGVVIISESVARLLWPGQDPIGRRVSMEDHPKPSDWLTIVGVVDDIRQTSPMDTPASAMYQPYAQIAHTFFLDHMTYAVHTTGEPHALASALRNVLRAIDKDQPVQILETMDDLVAATTADRRFQMRLLAAFSVLALALAAIGIYGVIGYGVTERTHEIGVRMALGARAADVLAMILRRALLLASIGVVIGVAGALALTRVLANLLFQVKPTDTATFACVALLIACVALLAGLPPARRAARGDPMLALRHE